MPEPKPEVHHASAREMSFPKLNSTFYIGTARSMSFGRGDRIDRCLLSELAFYEDPERIYNAVDGAVPLQGKITIECTPNGEDNLFYKLWHQARSGKSIYKPFFFPWWAGADYSIPRDSEFALPQDRRRVVLTEEEVELVSRFKLTTDQIRWRRRKISEKGGLFYQEFPEDELTCFMSAGEPVFDQNRLRQLSVQCSEGLLHPTGFRIWREPIKGEQYTLSADSAGGGAEASSAAAVIDDGLRAVATFKGKLQPKVFAGFLDTMGRYYNNALLAVERNTPGDSVLAELMQYPNLYFQRDFITGKVTGKPGWWTSGPTKSYMVSKLREMLPQFECWDSEIVRQARGYRFVKFEPVNQTDDDLVIAVMIGLAIRQFKAGGQGFVGTARRWDW